MTELRAKGRLEKTIAGVLATLQSVVRFAIRNGWIVENPVDKLEAGERPRPVRRRQRVLGREEIARLLAACAPRYRPLIATGLYTGLRISELLGLIWDDIDLAAGELTSGLSSPARTAGHWRAAFRRRRRRRSAMFPWRRSSTCSARRQGRPPGKHRPAGEWPGR